MSLICCSWTEREKAHHDTASGVAAGETGPQAWMRDVLADRLVVVLKPL